MGKESTEVVSGGGVMQSIKEGAAWDVAMSGWALAHGVPIPPSIVKRVRVGVGRLIEGGFEVGEALVANFQAKHVFDGERRRATVLALSEAGTQKLVDSDPMLSEMVARSYINEHKLKFNNRASVAQVAMDEIGKTSFSDNEVDEGEIELDWLNHFSDIAGQKSTPEMQLLFGKILAGEIRKPGSFSPMTINVLANLTPKIARKFEKLCSISMRFDTKSVISLIMFPDFLITGIPKLHLEYEDLVLLRQYQLLGSETGTHLELLLGERNSFTIADQLYGIQALAQPQEAGETIRDFPIAAFTSVGNELRTLIQPSAPEWLAEKVVGSFTHPNWLLARLAPQSGEIES